MQGSSSCKPASTRLPTGLAGPFLDGDRVHFGSGCRHNGPQGISSPTGAPPLSFPPPAHAPPHPPKKRPPPTDNICGPEEELRLVVAREGRVASALILGQRVHLSFQGLLSTLPATEQSVQAGREKRTQMARCSADWASRAVCHHIAATCGAQQSTGPAQQPSPCACAALSLSGAAKWPSVRQRHHTGAAAKPVRLCGP